MKITEINLRKITKENLIKDLQLCVFQAPSTKEKKEILKRVELAINSGDYLKTRNGLIVSAFFDSDSTFEFIQRKGLFRYSKYVKNKCFVKNIATDFLEICTTLGFISNVQTDYLNSIINYSTVFDSYKQIDQVILKELKGFESRHKGRSLIKTLLSFTDFLFLCEFYPKTIDNLMDYHCRSKEEISSAVSYLIYFYSDRIRDTNIDIQFVAEDYIRSGEINKIIVAACFMLDFKEFEIYIDHFNYNCIKEGESLIIKPPFENFERSIQLGYIRTQIQQINDIVEPKDALSIEDIVDKLNAQNSFEFFKYTEMGGYPRYRVEIPESVYELLIENFIKPDAIFKEEVIYLSSIFKEQLLNFNDLSQIKLKEDLSLLDFMKVRRIFILFYLLFSKEIYKKEKIDSEVLFRSLIPVYHEELFYKLIKKLLPVDKIDSFLDIVCWDPSLDGVFDLQYRPILYFNGHFLISLSIFANSNTIRNLYASEYKSKNFNLLTDGLIDPLVDKLTHILKQANLNSFAQTTVLDTDIDVFAVFKNTLFIFECKHNLHPVSPYDLRTTYDYIKKAERQLDKISDTYNNGELLCLLEKKHNINLNGINNLQCCIILSNRLFNGNIFKYPVRNINEIDNAFNRGTMRTELGTFWLWKEKKLTLEFLLEYFNLNSQLVKLYYNSLSKKRITYQITIPVIKFDRYSLKFDVARPILKEFTDKLEKVDNPI